MLVARDGARWLPGVLSALAACTVRPLRVVLVDAGSTDGSPELLASLGPVLHLPRGTTYGAAVRAALSGPGEPTPFVWLLTDDAAPEPDALEQLLAAAADRPDAALLGPAVLDAADPRRYAQLGTSTSRDGRRDPGVEPGELDQGQHAAPRAALAVGTAGALVRRHVLDAVGGLDPDLPLREDLDLGWRVAAAGSAVLAVPAARVHSARATETGRRPLPAGRTARVDRRAAVRVLVTCAPAPVLLGLLPRLLVGGLLRALGALLVRRPEEALDELAGLAVLARPDRWAAARRRRSATRTAPWSAVRPLLAPALGRRPPRPPRQLTGLAGGLRSPGAALVVVLALVAALAARDLVGSGLLAGGALLPSPPTAADLWSAWLSGGEPALLPRALLATLALGAAPLSVDLLLLGALPLAALSAWPVSCRVTRSSALRVWATGAWALLAAVPAADGRLGAVVVHLALPALLLAGARRRSAHAAWALALAVALLAALAPLLWPLAALPALLVARRRALPVALLPAVLVVPRLLTDRLPTAAPDDPLGPVGLLLLGSPLVVAPLLLVALLALLRPTAVRRTAAGWGLALLGLLGALLADRLDLDAGPGLSLAAAGLLLAALTGAQDVPAVLGRSSLGTRQAAVALLAATAVLGPVLAAAVLVRDGLDGPLRRGGKALLPPFASAQLAAQDRALLLLTARPDGTVAAALTGPTGPRTDRPATRPPLGRITDLLATGSPDAVSGLADRGVRFVALRGPAPRLSDALDGTAGLDRRPAAPTPLWEVVAPGRPAGQEEPSRAPAVATGLVLLVAAVLAGPGRAAKRGLVRP